MYTVKKTFDSNNCNWGSDMVYNLLFLRSNQAYANDVLRARGYIFLNEVYDMIGLERTMSGAIAGWVCKPGNELKSFVNFEVHQSNEQIELTFNASKSILDNFSKD